MLDVTVIEDSAAAAASLDPIRARLLAELAGGPASAAMLAGRVGLPRQKVNYHLKTLERHGLVELAGERRKGNVTERLMRATAASYVISPSALAAVQPDPERFRDELSARWLLAVAARLVRDVGALITGAARARQRVATFALDGEVTFASAAERAAFVEELTRGVSALVAKYHAPEAAGGRPHRVVVALHPGVKPETLAELSGAGDGAAPEPHEPSRSSESSESPEPSGSPGPPASGRPAAGSAAASVSAPPAGPGAPAPAEDVAPAEGAAPSETPQERRK
jgi:DNA-binding transcriptional ArsR family regulator